MITSVTSQVKMESDSKKIQQVPQIPSYIFFAGAAWGCGFYIGVYKALEEMYGLELLKKVKFAGNSAGGLFAACCAAQVGWQRAEKIYLSLAGNAIKKGVFQKMSIYHEGSMDNIFSDDKAIYERVNGKLFIGISTWFDDYHIISSWQNNKELRDCLHASMHIPYYCTHTAKVRCVDGRLRRAIDGGCGKSFHRFGRDTLVVTVLNKQGDIISDPTLTMMGDCYEPDVAKYFKMRDNGYKAMKKWDGNYKWVEYDKYTQSKYTLREKRRMINIRNIVVFVLWCLRIAEEIKVKRILMFIVLAILYRKYRKLIS